MICIFVVSALELWELAGGKLLKFLHCGERENQGQNFAKQICTQKLVELKLHILVAEYCSLTFHIQNKCEHFHSSLESVKRMNAQTAMQTVQLVDHVMPFCCNVFCV